MNSIFIEAGDIFMRRFDAPHQYSWWTPGGLYEVETGYDVDGSEFLFITADDDDEYSLTLHGTDWLYESFTPSPAPQAVVASAPNPFGNVGNPFVPGDLVIPGSSVSAYGNGFLNLTLGKVYVVDEDLNVINDIGRPLYSFTTENTEWFVPAPEEQTTFYTVNEGDVFMRRHDADDFIWWKRGGLYAVIRDIDGDFAIRCDDGDTFKLDEEDYWLASNFVKVVYTWTTPAQPPTTPYPYPEPKIGQFYRVRDDADTCYWWTPGRTYAVQAGDGDNNEAYPIMYDDDLDAHTLEGHMGAEWMAENFVLVEGNPFKTGDLVIPGHTSRSGDYREDTIAGKVYVVDADGDVQVEFGGTYDPWFSDDIEDGYVWFFHAPEYAKEGENYDLGEETGYPSPAEEPAEVLEGEKTEDDASFEMPGMGEFSDMLAPFLNALAGFLDINGNLEAEEETTEDCSCGCMEEPISCIGDAVDGPTYEDVDPATRPILVAFTPGEANILRALIGDAREEMAASYYEAQSRLEDLSDKLAA